MIHSDSIEKRSPFLRILSEDQIFEIKRAAFDIMLNVGFKVLHKGARKMLKQILDTHNVLSLPDKTIAALDKIKYKGEAELKIKIS